MSQATGDTPVRTDNTLVTHDQLDWLIDLALRGQRVVCNVGTTDALESLLNKIATDRRATATTRDIAHRLLLDSSSPS